MFLCPKLGITPVFCNMLHSVKMQRKAHIYSRNLKNSMSFCVLFISCPSCSPSFAHCAFLSKQGKRFELSLRDEELTVDYPRDWWYHTEWLDVSWDASLLSSPWYHMVGLPDARVPLDSCPLQSGRTEYGQGKDAMQKGCRRFTLGWHKVQVLPQWWATHRSCTCLMHSQEQEP